MGNITARAGECKSELIQDVAFDVSKRKLNALMELDGVTLELEFVNSTPEIEKRLKKWAQLAMERGKPILRVVCEPTGTFHEKLLRTARRLGHVTAFVNAEAVCKFRGVETNDSGKTDLKDPHVINTLTKLNKLRTHRLLEDEYLVLRKLGKFYDEGQRGSPIEEPPSRGRGGALL